MLRLLPPVVLLTTLAAQDIGIVLTNGIDGYVEVPYSPNVVPQSGITFEAWISYDDTTLGAGYRWPTIVRQNIAPGQESFFLRVNAANTSQTVLRWKVVTQTGSMVCDWPFASGQLLTMTHVAATYDGNMAALYVDGAQVATAPGTGQPIWDRGGVLRIGKGDDSGGPIEVWHGEIDEVRLWPFARTAAEITQTRTYEVDSWPGRVSSWELNTHTFDTSGGQHGMIVGTVAYQANTVALTSLLTPLVGAQQTSSPGCSGPLMMSAASMPFAGSTFAPICTSAPGGAPTFLAMGFVISPIPFQIAGIDVWIDTSFTVLTLASTDALGTSRFAVPLPGWLPAGQGFAFQYGFVDSCGSQGVTASDALAIISG